MRGVLCIVFRKGGWLIDSIHLRMQLEVNARTNAALFYSPSADALGDAVTAVCVDGLDPRPSTLRPGDSRPRCGASGRRAMAAAATCRR